MGWQNFVKREPGEAGLAGLFNGDILEDSPEQKQFIRATFEKKVGKGLFKTRLVWRMDPLNETNFHKYIDDHEHLLLIVELENGHRVGGYSEAKLQPKMQSNKDGLLLSISNKEAF